MFIKIPKAKCHDLFTERALVDCSRVFVPIIIIVESDFLKTLIS